LQLLIYTGRRRTHSTSQAR